MIELRPYQVDALQALRDRIRAGKRRIVLVGPTGMGKTVCISAMIKGALERGKRSVFLAHRSELIEQCSDKLRDLDVPHGIIQANNPLFNPERQVQVASVQTLINRDHWDADLIVVDECHRSVSKSYVEIIKRYSNPVLIGITATAWRMDGRGLGEVVLGDEPLYQDLYQAISTQELVDQEYLIEPEVYGSSRPDLSNVDSQMGDYKKDQLAEAMEPVILHGKIVSNWIAHFPDKDACTVVFAASVEQSKQIAAQFREAGISAEHIDGNKKTTSNTRRKDVINRVREKDVKVITNYGLLCLDSKTEILTDVGWLGINDVTKFHYVANWWPDGHVTFSPPKRIIKRKTFKDEKMVRLPGKRMDIRVTDRHRVIFKKSLKKSGSYGPWHEDEAENLLQKMIYIPVSGNSDPFDIEIEQEELPSEKTYKRRMVSNSYHLRKNNGFSFEGSKIEAKKRLDERLSLKWKNPKDLSIDECWFIGFWLADGNVSKLKGGGLEYSISQSERYADIIDKLEQVIGNIGLDYVIKYSTAPYTKFIQRKYSFGRGTGFGPQRVNGVYSIEIYLNKNGAYELWGLNRDQFWSLMCGFWAGDGLHGKNAMPIKKSLLITNTNFKLLSHLQAVASCRGFHCSISKPRYNGTISTKPIHALTIKEKDLHPLTNNRFEYEILDKKEDVWCCDVNSKYIITRRGGKVSILGNCEGWDLPHLECVVLARPTKSKSLYKQMVGRLMRPDDNKRWAIVLDHANCTYTHGFVTENIEYSLSGREKRPRKGQDSKAPVKECNNCKRLCPASSPKCQACGYEFPKRDFEYTDEQLVRLEKGKIKRKKSVPRNERQLALDKLCLKCKESGYKPNWAKVQYMHAFGEWPSWNSGVTFPKFFREYEKAFEGAK